MLVEFLLIWRSHLELTDPCSENWTYIRVLGTRSVITIGASYVDMSNPSYWPGQCFGADYAIGGGDRYDYNILYYYGGPISDLTVKLYEVGYLDSDGQFEASEDVSMLPMETDLFDLKYNWELMYMYAQSGYLSCATAIQTDGNGYARLTRSGYTYGVLGNNGMGEFREWKSANKWTTKIYNTSGKRISRMD